jgi:hypothetical protein
MKPDAIEAARRAVQADRAGHRFFALWTAERVEGCGPGAPVASLFSGTGYHRWYLASSDQLPKLLHTRPWDPGDLALTKAKDEIEVTAARTWLFLLPLGALVAGLSIDFLDRRASTTLDPLPNLFADLDRDREALRIGTSGVLTACLEGCEEVPGDLSFAGDFHGVLLVASDSLPSGEELDRQLLMSLVSRRASPSRDDFLTARFPPEPNRYYDMAAAVTPGATALTGHPPEVELAVVLCAVQAIAALASLRHIQRRAFAALRTLREHGRQVDGWLGERLDELRALEVDLSFGVEASLDQRLLVPSLPIEQIHRAMVEALSIERGAAVTGTMLVRLATAIGVEESRLVEAERRRSQARRTAAAAAAGVAGIVALPLAFLGTNDAQVSAGRSMFDLGYYWPYYSVLIAIVVLTATLARVYVLRAGE